MDQSVEQDVDNNMESVFLGKQLKRRRLEKE
jgi:hypothetical protein